MHLILHQLYPLYHLYQDKQTMNEEIKKDMQLLRKLYKKFPEVIQENALNAPVLSKEDLKQQQKQEALEIEQQLMHIYTDSAL